MINPTDKKPEHAKTTNNVRSNDDKPQADLKNNGTKVKKDLVIIAGDLMIKHVNGHDISRSDTVKVCPNLGASTHDLMDYVKPAMWKKPKTLVIHTDTSDT